jgi:hypothetical protein
LVVRFVEHRDAKNVFFGDLVQVIEERRVDGAGVSTLWVLSAGGLGEYLDHRHERRVLVDDFEGMR